MSAETMTDLNQNTLIGYTEKRGNAWHYRKSEQGAEPNHYEGAIPVEDVRRRLFNWTALEGNVSAAAITPTGVVASPAPEHKAIMRSDTGKVLSIMGAGYQPHQYDDWLIQNVENLLDADLHIGSAGLLKGGRQAWVQIEMEDTLEVAEVRFRPFLTAATSLDGSLATTYLNGAQVVVCDNTLSAALGSASERIKITHTSRSLLRLGEARQALGIVHQVAEAFEEQVRALTAEVVTDAVWNDFVKAHAGWSDTLVGRSKTTAENRMGALHRLWNSDERVAPWRGSAYGVVAAVNTYTHHEQTVRGATRAERNADRMVQGKHDALDRSTLQLLAEVR